MSRIPVKLQIPNPISNYSLFNGYTADLFYIILIDAIAQITVFSLNFSSAGKGPFMDGKAKYILF